MRIAMSMTAVAISLLVWHEAVQPTRAAAEVPLPGAPATRITGAALADGYALHIDADYPGGNILFERIENDVVHVRQDLRDTEGWWFYWNFRVRGAASRLLTFRFTDRNPIGVRGPAVSTDGGASWSWLGSQAVDGPSFRYAFGRDANDVRFCFAIPYQEADLKRFLDRHAANASLQLDTLCKTHKGRTVERLHAGKLAGEPEYRVLVTCRHHACETMASWSLEGLMEGLLSDTDDGAWLRWNVELMAIPFMDKDGVEDGDQGKNRRPHDHNRDYAGEAIYREVRALRELVPHWSRGRLRVAIDLHDPHIRGPHNDVIYQVGSRNAATWEEQRAFGAILEAARTGPLPYHAKDDLPFGQAWNKAQNYSAGRGFGSWAGELKDIRLATTIELPYADASGGEVTPATARAFGRDLARAIAKYLASRR